ncbi:MAG: transposase [Deltaproteobacteria bacterium]|nr:transposase [Deltaproteobacteria bacterium]
MENLFAKIKHFRSVATRYDKLTRNYQATVYLAGIVVWARL